MLRIVFGVIVGFFAWLLLWVGSEKLVSAIWPESLGAHQRAFEAAIINGGPFTADTTLLLTHIVSGSIVSLLAGVIAALSAGENKRAPFALGLLLVALGLLKAVLTWPYVPIWYHVMFTALLLPLTTLGGKLKTRIQEK